MTELRTVEVAYPTDPVILLLGTFPKKCNSYQSEYINNVGNIVCNCHRLETIKMLIKGVMCIVV